jgi:hypothetical protein
VAATVVVVLGGGSLGLYVSDAGPSWLGGSGHDNAASSRPLSTGAPVTTTPSTPSATASSPAAVPPTDTVSPTDTVPPTDTGSPDGTATPDPAGYHLFDDPAGFTLRVPDGWQRTTSNGQIYYSPDGNNHLLQIGVNPADGSTTEQAMQQVDTGLSGRTHYRRISLATATTADGGRMTTLEYTYANDRFGNRHAIDRDFLSADGDTMYFLLSTGPSGEWPATLSRFTTAFASFCQTQMCDRSP